MKLSGAPNDPTVVDVIERLDMPDVQDLGIVIDHGDGHPVSRLTVDDYDASARRLRTLFPQTGYWPLLLLEDIVFERDVPRAPTSTDMATMLTQGWRHEDIVTGVEAVKLAAGLALDDAPYCGIFGGRPAGSTPEIRPQSAHPYPEEAAVLGRGWLPRHGLLLVPVRAPWESLAHIGFGSWNESPADAGHVRFQRYLWEACQGVVSAVGCSRMNVEMPRPPQDLTTAFLLASRLFEYCRDLETVMSDFLNADPDEQDFTALLVGILTSGLPVLPLWWD